MRPEGRTPVAAMDRMSCMRPEGGTPVAAMGRMSCMRQEGGTPVAAQTRLYRLDRLFQTRSTTCIL